jgi:hypothetical protein
MSSVAENYRAGVRRSTDERSGLSVDDVRAATRGFRKCERLLSVQVTVDAPLLQSPVAAGGGRLDALRVASTARLGADRERFASELVRGDLG